MLLKQYQTLTFIPYVKSLTFTSVPLLTTSNRWNKILSIMSKISNFKSKMKFHINFGVRAIEIRQFYLKMSLISPCFVVPGGLCFTIVAVPRYLHLYFCGALGAPKWTKVTRYTWVHFSAILNKGDTFYDLFALPHTKPLLKWGLKRSNSGSKFFLYRVDPVSERKKILLTELDCI